MAGEGIVARRRGHIEQLCLAHRIGWTHTDGAGSHGRADTEARHVLIPPTTRVRSYYVALHEIAHCVLGYDEDQPVAPQEVAAWRWAVEQAIEPPSEGVKRHMFRVLWHYLVVDLSGARRTIRSASARPFPPPGDSFWAFLSSLDEGSRLLYEAAKVLANVGPIKRPETRSSR